MRAALALVLAAAALSATGCGGAIGDLIAISTTGAGDDHRLLVTGDGQGSCDGGPKKMLPSAMVLDAREVERELAKPAKAHASYVTGAPPGARHYVARTKAGTVIWAEGAHGAPPVVAKGIALVQELKRLVCSSASGP